MKLIIQIPCFNEARTLPLVFKDMPQEIEGIDEIEYQIIDDGSTDETVEVARRLGVHHIVSVTGRNRRWLGRTFKLGVDNALKNGADILVNTDGDNQYPARYIEDLVRPIIKKRAQIVIGDRNPGANKEFSHLKRTLQRLGSKTVEVLSGASVPDAVSGFRAYSREALLKINVMTHYTYTIDTIIQANKKGLDIAWVPIQVNPSTRPSRLIKNIASKVRKSGFTILRLTTIYQPLRTFCAIGGVFLVIGSLLLGRFFYYYLFVPAHASGHVQSVVVGGVFLVLAVQLFSMGIIGDLLAANRSLVEDLLSRIKYLEAREYSRDKYSERDKHEHLKKVI